jgi:hypothetical protein
MVSSLSTVTDVVIERRHQKYHWPAVQLNFWVIIMLVGSATNLGVFANFMTVQTQLQLGIPWYVSLHLSAIPRRPRGTKLTPPPRYFPYWISVGSVSILFILIMLWLISQRQLLPGLVIIGAFILFVLWTVGFIVISVQLWGATGINSNCQLYVSSAPRGPTTDALAWLEQHSICTYLLLVALPSRG